jgi:hypothetical protein
MKSGKFARGCAIVISLGCGVVSAQEPESETDGFAIETIDDPAEVEQWKARGKPVDLVAALLAATDGANPYDLEYDDRPRFARHEPERTRELFANRLADPSLPVDARIDAARMLAAIGDPRGAEYLLSREKTEDPHELAQVLWTVAELGVPYRQKAILAASVLSESAPTANALTDELISACASIAPNPSVVSLVAARFARLEPGSLPSSRLSGALASLLRARDPRLRAQAQAIRNRFVNAMREDLAAFADPSALPALLFRHVDPADASLLRDAMPVFAGTHHEYACVTALVSIESDPALVDWAIENGFHSSLAEGLLRAKYDVGPALARLREEVDALDENDWAPWVLLASRGTREDRAAAKQALEGGALEGEAAYLLAAELNAITTDEALAELVALGLVDSDDVAMAGPPEDDEFLDATAIAMRLCEGPSGCLLPVTPEGDDYVLAVIYRVAGISSGKLRFESASVTSTRDEDEGTGERTIELVANGVGHRVVAPIEDLDDDDFEPDVAPLLALCDRVLEANGIAERLHVVAFDDPVLLFADPKAVTRARERGYLPK